MTLRSNGAADAGVESDKTPNPARPTAILSTIGLRGIANPLLLFYWIKLNLSQNVAYGAGGGGGGGLP